MDSTAIRSRLDALIASRGEDYASLSRLLGRNASYVQQFIKRGVPRRLSESDRRILSRHFGIAEHLLGGPAEEGRAILVVTHDAELAKRASRRIHLVDGRIVSDTR